MNTAATIERIRYHTMYLDLNDALACSRIPLSRWELCLVQIKQSWANSYCSLITPEWNEIIWAHPDGPVRVEYGDVSLLLLLLATELHRCAESRQISDLSNAVGLWACLLSAAAVVILLEAIHTRRDDDSFFSSTSSAFFFSLSCLSKKRMCCWIEEHEMMTINDFAKPKKGLQSANIWLRAFQEELRYFNPPPYVQYTEPGFDLLNPPLKRKKNVIG